MNTSDCQVMNINGGDFTQCPDREECFALLIQCTTDYVAGTYDILYHIFIISGE